MKHLIFTLLCLILPFIPADAQDRNSKADNIIGKYFVLHEGEESKVEVTEQPDGTYTARVYWVKDAYDKDGKKRVDEKNPDKELRNVPCDEIVLFRDLRYNSDRKRWDKGKIYDPTRGIRANLTASFNASGNLLVKGSLLGFSETIVWQPICE